MARILRGNRWLRSLLGPGEVTVAEVREYAGAGRPVLAFPHRLDAWQPDGWGFAPGDILEIERNGRWNFCVTLLGGKLAADAERYIDDERHRIGGPYEDGDEP